ncbi:MAG: hypothetical protein ACMUIP_10155 [bacterium]
MIKIRKILILVLFIIFFSVFTHKASYATYIKGKIVNTKGLPINDVLVKIYIEDPNTGQFLDKGIGGISGYDRTQLKPVTGNFLIPQPFLDQNGNLQSQQLPTNRRYIVHILPYSESLVQNPDNGFIAFYHNNALDIKDAVKITLTSFGYDCGEIELKRKGASIKGKVWQVISPDRAENIRILVFNENGQPDYNHVGKVDSNGEYFIGGLNSGTYFVKADTTVKNCPNDYVSSYYTEDRLGAIGIQGATGIYLNAHKDWSSTPDQKSGIDFFLKKGAKIQGSVKDAQGNLITDTTLNIQLFLAKDGLLEQTDLKYILDSNYSQYPQQFQAQLPYFWQSSESGRYEITGIPYSSKGDYSYYISILEMTSSPGVLMPQNNPQYLATYLFYSNDGKNGTFNSKEATKITPVKSTSETSYTYNFTLPEGGAISGTVNLADPTDLSDVRILISAVLNDPNQSPPVLVSTSISGEGEYSLKGLPKGKYIIAADTQAPVGYKKHLQAFYNNAINRYTATDIPLNNYGDSKENINLHLPLGGTLEGRVVDADTKAGIPGIYAHIYKADDWNPIQNIASLSISSGNYASFGVSDENGNYRLTGIEAGTYYLVLSHISADSEQDNYYTATYYNGTAEGSTVISEATSIVMKNKCNGIDCTTYNPTDFIKCETGSSLATVQLKKIKAGTISGLIALETKGELTPADIALFLFNVEKNMPCPYLAIPQTYDATKHQTIAFNPPGLTKDATNTIFYSFNGVEEGEYRLKVLYKSMPHYPAHSGYMDTGDFKMSKSITISSVEDAASVSFLLSEYTGSIEGSVVYNGEPVSDISIQLFRKTKIGYREEDTWDFVGTVISQEDGSYTIPGLSVGDYIVLANDLRLMSIFAPQYYSSHSIPELTIEEAEPITITAQNMTVSNKNFNLSTGGEITGTIIDQNGDIYPDCAVQVFYSKDKFSYLTPIKGAIPNPETGEFKITGLKQDKYAIRIVGPSGNVLGYYTKQGNDPLDAPKAKDISIDAINTSTSLGNIKIIHGAYEITGYVYRQGDPQWPLVQIEISAYKYSDNDTTLQLISNTYSDQRGLFTLTGLHEGKYSIVALDVRTIYNQAGNPKYTGTGNFSSMDVTVPLSSDITISIPLETNERELKLLSLKTGLNLIAYPTRVSLKPPLYNSLNFMNDISLTSGFSNLNLMGFNNEQKLFVTNSFHTSIANIQGYTTKGSLFPLYNGCGYLLYTDRDKDISFSYFPGQKKINLAKGRNIVGNILVDQAGGEQRTSKDLLEDIGADTIISVHNYDPEYGTWKSNYWLWGKSVGNNNEIIEDNKGYLINMKESLPDWSL